MAKRQQKLPRKSSGRMASKGYPNPIDVHVGARIRLRRTLLGITQEKLADVLGLTFQQVQKYEKGLNRVGSSRLVDMANALDVEIPYFFEEMSAAVEQQTPSALLKAGKRPTADGNETDLLARRETLEFVRAYYKIQDPAVRKRVAELTKIIAKASD
jgi:transcriptional regulator with XRE-family HTH domain